VLSPEASETLIQFFSLYLHFRLRASKAPLIPRVILFSVQGSQFKRKNVDRIDRMNMTFRKEKTISSSFRKSCQLPLFFFFLAQPFTHSRQFIDAVVHRLMKKEATDSGGNNFC
jgi:hypothetical protein